jgi:hypothetical protein
MNQLARFQRVTKIAEVAEWKHLKNKLLAVSDRLA